MEALTTTWGRFRKGADLVLTLHADAVVIVFIVIGFGLCLLEASQTWLNPDEARYFWMSSQDTLLESWHASHNTHHPPLLVIVLYYIGKVSQTHLQHPQPLTHPISAS